MKEIPESNWHFRKTHKENYKEAFLPGLVLNGCLSEWLCFVFTGIIPDHKRVKNVRRPQVWFLLLLALVTANLVLCLLHSLQASLSVTNSRRLLKLVSTSQWCHPTLSPSVGTSLFIGLFSIVKIPTAKLSPQSSFGISHSKTASSCAALRVFKMLFIYWNCTLPRENGFSELTQSFFYVSTTSRSQDDAGILVISTVTSGQLGLLLSC